MFANPVVGATFQLCIVVLLFHDVTADTDIAIVITAVVDDLTVVVIIVVVEVTLAIVVIIITQKLF